MVFNFKHHLRNTLFSIFFILLGCQLQEPAKNHGILFLDNRSEKLAINKSNKNDVIKILGQPHAKTFDEEDLWIYIERTLTKGKYHKLGRHELKTNNTLVLNFDKYGILKSKDFYDKNNINKIKFSKKTTENNLSKRSFVESFLQSVKKKMYGSRK
jgi:outer membrane protein assembly factor BamE (lipoprotein component of BamABCDE complex)